MTVLVEAFRLRKTFGPIVAVDGITLSVNKGEVLGFLGPNGAGKSTTMKMLTGFLEPDSGSARIAGIDIKENPKAAKMRFGYLPEGAPGYGEMTPWSFLSFIAEIRGFDREKSSKRVAAAVEKTGLESVLDQKIDTLSKGFRRRVGLAQSVLHDPDVLILDEPTDGLDPNQKHQVRRLIADMAKDKAIIVSTHILEEVEAVCSRAVIINRGRIVADGTAEDLMKREARHGAVAIRLAADKAAALTEALAKVAGVDKVEKVSVSASQALVRALPKGGAQIGPAVAALLKDSAIPIEELSVEKGRLDDVFRQITTTEDARPHA